MPHSSASTTPKNPSAWPRSADAGATSPNKAPRNESGQPSNALQVPAPRTRIEAAGAVGDKRPASEEPNDAHIRSPTQTTGWPAAFQSRNRPLYCAQFPFQKPSKRYMLSCVVKHTAKYRGPTPCDYAGQPP
jgi:hypothetical protein